MIHAINLVLSTKENKKSGIHLNGYLWMEWM